MRCKSCNSILSEEECKTCWPIESIKHISYIDICFNCIKQTELATYFFPDEDLNEYPIIEENLDGD